MTSQESQELGTTFSQWGDDCDSRQKRFSSSPRADQTFELCEPLTLICPEENKTPNKSDFATVWNLGHGKINQFLESVIRYIISSVTSCSQRFFFWRFIRFMFTSSTVQFRSVHPSIHPFAISCDTKSL